MMSLQEHINHMEGTMISNCLHCSKDFKSRPSEGRKFCGHACYRAYEGVHGRPRDIVPITLTCKHCGNAFTQNPGEYRAYVKAWGKEKPYCSRACSNKGRELSDDQWQVHCVQCGKPMPIQRRPGGTINRQKKLCSPECRSAFKIAEHERLRPSETRTIGKRIRKGYVVLRFPNQEGVKGRSVLEHRYVMEQHLGRELRPEETVHHRNRPTTNNALDNLELFSGRHGPGQRVTDQVSWAIAILADYPEFAREAGAELVMRPGVH
jgi:hypothetical protein